MYIFKPSDHNQMCVRYDLLIASHTFQPFSYPFIHILKQNQTSNLQFDFKLILIMYV